ncbi:FxDxF family PEP-CTERM protein [Pseudoduganella sp. UC29_71]|uniref:FxDxF family PEP-CTERM protein n=1 Tax=Pseudoduganella sp. UC29_71 TaxID=3350174 RepID=UPI00366E1A54
MKLLNYLAAAALAAACGHAAAEDLTKLVTLTGAPPLQTAGYSMTHLLSGDFTDTITFTPTVGSSFVDASLITIGLDATNIDFHSIMLGSTPMTITTDGGGLVEAAATYHSSMAGLLEITVWGTAGGGGPAGTPINAVYSGTLNVLAVPEPATYGMLLGGLGVLGWLARRRSAQAG